MAFGRDDISAVRALVAGHAEAAGLPRGRASDLVLAASEAATNSVLHGGGDGTAAVWREGDAVVCEVRDAGRISDPLAGRRRPSLDAFDGRGLWVVHQLCDLVEVRNLAAGTVVRFRMARA
jgi:anti-sigma regulatory factor (Ser/Thr protein kinase)